MSHLWKPPYVCVPFPFAPWNFRSPGSHGAVELWIEGMSTAMAENDSKCASVGWIRPSLKWYNSYGHIIAIREEDDCIITRTVRQAEFGPLPSAPDAANCANLVARERWPWLQKDVTRIWLTLIIFNHIKGYDDNHINDVSLMIDMTIEDEWLS